MRVRAAIRNLSGHADAEMAEMYGRRGGTYVDLCGKGCAQKHLAAWMERRKQSGEVIV